MNTKNKKRLLKARGEALASYSHTRTIYFTARDKEMMEELQCNHLPPLSASGLVRKLIKEEYERRSGND
jgi:hypothetical protein